MLHSDKEKSTFSFAYVIVFCIQLYKKTTYHSNVRCGVERP